MVTKALMRIAICSLCMLVFIIPALAETNNFQNDGGSWGSTYGTAILNTYAYTDCYSLYNGGGTFGANLIHDKLNSNDLSYTGLGGANVMTLYSMAGSLMYNSASIPSGRIRIIYNGSMLNGYKNGVLQWSVVPSANGPIGEILLSGTTASIDDFATEGADVVGGPPHSWFIGKDLLTPSIYGLFNNAYAQQNGSYIHVTYGSTVPNQTIYVDGCSPVVATGYSGVASIDISPLIATNNYGVKGIRYGNATDYITYKATTIAADNISWDKAIYATGDTATISYSVGSPHWDPSTFDYKIKIYQYANASTTLMQTQSITLQNGTISYTMPSAGYYVADLILDYKVAPNTDYVLADAWAASVYGALFYGNTYDGSTGALLGSVTLNITQMGTTTSLSSDGSGAYNSSTVFSTGSQIDWVATKTNYTQANFSYTFSAPGTYQVDMSLLPYNGTSAPVDNGTPIWNGTAIYGLVMASPSGAAVPNATMTCTNGTAGLTWYTSDSGYYHFDNLAANSTYTVGAYSSGYGTTPNVSVTTGGANTGARQDFILTQGYSVAVDVFDAVTLAPINGAYVTVNGGSGQTATGGSTSYNLPYGYYTIAASANNYNPNSVSQAITQGMTIYLYLTPLNTNNNATSNVSGNVSIGQQGYGMSYAPHNVRFTVQTLYGIPIDDVTVTAQGYQTTAGSFQWLYDILGWHTANETPIANTLLNGTTDHLGQINFMMFEPVKYHMTFYKAGVINVTWEFYPKDEYYTVVSGALSNATWYQGSYNIQEVILSNVTAYEDNGTISLQYLDLINSTKNGTIWLNQTNKTNVTFPDTSLYNFTVPNATLTNASNWSFDFHMTNYPGQSYIVRFRMNSSVFTQQIQRDYGVTFRKEQINPMKLTDFELMLISMFLLIFLGCFFGAVQAPQGPLLICFCGWILWGIGWMNAVGSIATVTLTLATFISVAVLIFVRSRKGTWF